ncbi:hypothetical protein Tco_1092592 [Tanacetum coccineum]|uniref:Uncharacterized protein n=1 Tax=Tanacetum coccineum TaxID=301880 RepID=A0ABQ5IAB2_9ASTR
MTFLQVPSKDLKTKPSLDDEILSRPTSMDDEMLPSAAAVDKRANAAAVADAKNALITMLKHIREQVMAALVISISSDSSEESVGSHALRVILFGTIPTSILVISVILEVPIAPVDLIVAPEVGAVSVISPTGVLDLVADSESEPAVQRPERHESLTPSFEFQLAPVVAPPRIFGPFPACRLAWRWVSHHSSNRHSSPYFTSDSSSSGSSSDSLSDSSSVHSSGMDVEVATSDIREDEEEFEVEANVGGTMEIVVDPLATGDISEPTGGDAPDLEGTLYDRSHYMSEVSLDRITEFETAQRQLEVGQLKASRERDLEEFRQVCRDHDDTRRRLRRLESLVERRLGFFRCNVLRWLKVKTKRLVAVSEDMRTGGNGMVEMEMVEMEMVEMEIQMIMIENSHKRTIGTDAAFAMLWRELMKLMAEMYCPRNEIQKMESEL